MLAPPGPIATNRFLFKEMNYDSTKWVPVSWLTTVPYVLTVRSSFKGDLKELIAQAKAGKITVALPGPGGAGASLGRAPAGDRRREDGLRPLQGLGTAMNDIVAGHVDMMFDTLTTSLPLHQQGRVRIIAVASPKRFAVLPDVPTVAESGYPTLPLDHLVRSGGAAGHAARRLPTGSARTSARSIKSPQVSSGSTPCRWSRSAARAQEAAAFFADEARLLGPVIKDANIALQ